MSISSRLLQQIAAKMLKVHTGRMLNIDYKSVGDVGLTEMQLVSGYFVESHFPGPNLDFELHSFCCSQAACNVLVFLEFLFPKIELKLHLSP